jgi:hypothetical protein
MAAGPLFVVMIGSGVFRPDPGHLRGQALRVAADTLV